MTDRSTALSLLRRALGDNAASFRDGQWEAIDALVNRRERLLVVQRTGSHAISFRVSLARHLFDSLRLIEAFGRSDDGTGVGTVEIPIT